MERVKQILAKYKYNAANGVWLPMFLTTAFIAFGWMHAPGVTEAGLIIMVGIPGAFFIAIGFNGLQAKFTPNHGFGANEFKEAAFTGFGAWIGAPLSYVLYLWLGETYWQLIPGLLIALPTIYLWKKG